MPYSITKSESKCSKGKPFAVTRDDGTVVPGGCHPTHAKALAHQRALMVNVPDAQKPTKAATASLFEDIVADEVAHSLEVLGADGESETAGLNARQLAMLDATRAIAAKFGKFDQTPGPDGGHYALAADNPFKDAGIMCQNCAMFDAPGSCEVVAGTIEPKAVCKLWVIAGQKLNG